MLKYYNYDIVFQEVPDEVTLAVNLSNCPNHCPGCHSPHLCKDIGNRLDEETISNLYHLDRMMLNLKMSGKLAKLRGLVVGTFSDMKDNASPFGKTAYEIVKAHTAEYSYPIGFGLPVGHIDDNQPLVEGGQYRLEISDRTCSLKMI